MSTLGSIVFSDIFSDIGYNPLLIPLVNQIHHDLHHYILFLGAALGNHQREGHEGVVRQALGAIGAVEDWRSSPNWSRRRRSFTA